MSPFARRIRRCVVIAMLFGLAAGVCGVLPGRHLYLSDGGELLTAHAAGGPLFFVYLVIVLGYGAMLYRDPSRAAAIGWTAFALIIGLVLTLLALGDGDNFARVQQLWPVRAMLFAFGGMLLMIFPFAFVNGLIGDRGKRSDAASARVLT